MKTSMSPPGKILFTISLLSLVYAAWLFHFGLSGVYNPNFGDWLFFYYTIQVIIFIVAAGIKAFHGIFTQKDILWIVRITFFNLAVYAFLSISFGTFFIYAANMAEMLANVLNNVFLACVLFWIIRLLC